MYFDLIALNGADHAKHNPSPVQIALGVGGALALVGALVWATSGGDAQAADALDQEAVAAGPPDEAQIETIARAIVGDNFERVRNIRTLPEGYLARVELKKSAKNQQGLGPQVEILVAFDYQTANIVKEIPEFHYDKWKAEGEERKRKRDKSLKQKGYTVAEVNALKCPLVDATNDLLGILGELNNPAKRSSTFLASGRNIYAEWKEAYTNWWKGVQAVKSTPGFAWYTGTRSRPNLVPNIADAATYYDMDSPDPSAALNKALATLILGWSLGIPTLIYKRETPSYGGVTGDTLLAEIESRNDTDGLNLMMALYDSYINETGNSPGVYINASDYNRLGYGAC